MTFIGIIPQIAFFLLMRGSLFGWALLALALSFIDMLDGLAARANDRVTAFGAVLDSVLDRVADFLIIGGFYAGGLVSLNLAAMLLLAAYLTSYIRSRAELAADGKIKFNNGLIERPERIIYLFVVLALHLVFPNATNLVYNLVILLTILSFVTVCQRLWKAYERL